jgi:hypothetical protein
MVFGDLSSILASQYISKLYRRAEHNRLADGSRRRKRLLLAADTSRALPTTEGRTAMITQHDHRPGEFDAGHCGACAREAGLLDHYHRVQQEARRLQAAQWSAWQARGIAIWSLCSSGDGILLAAIALLAN